MARWSRGLRTNRHGASDLHSDLIVVGSGPAHLVRAINASLDGKRTLVVESAGHIGGAWAAVPAFGDDVHRYEIVPHHLSPYLDAYEMLKDSGIELVSRPIHVWDHAKLSRESATWYRQNYGESFPVATADGTRLVHEDQWYAHQDWLNADPHADIEHLKNFHRDTNANLRYFAGGIQELIDRLVRRLRESGCSVMTCTPVGKISPAQAHIEVLTPRGTMVADQVLLGQHYSGELDLSGLPDEPKVTNSFASLLVQARLSEPQDVRYVNVKSDPGKKFGPISYLQLTKSQVNIYRDQIVTYCIGGSFGPKHDASDAARSILRKMSEIGIIVGDYEIWDACWHRAEVQSQTRGYCATVASASHNRITMSHVAALGQEMSEHIEAWRKALGD